MRASACKGHMAPYFSDHQESNILDSNTEYFVDEFYASNNEAA